MEPKTHVSLSTVKPFDTLKFCTASAGSVANGKTNQLFFTAGPNNYADGLFGVISFAEDDEQAIVALIALESDDGTLIQS